MPFTDTFSGAAVQTLLPALAAAYLFFSVVALFDYARDKAAARAGRRRIPEARLLLLGAVGGWPGALLAQRLLRHKTAKARFQLQFWVSVVLNLLVNGAMLMAARA